MRETTSMAAGESSSLTAAVAPGRNGRSSVPAWNSQRGACAKAGPALSPLTEGKQNTDSPPAGTRRAAVNTCRHPAWLRLAVGVVRRAARDGAARRWQALPVPNLEQMGRIGKCED